MRKIISLFQRNYDSDYLVRNELVEGAEWVANGEGHATVKLDGTCCMVLDGKLFKRREIKKPHAPEPEGFVFAQRDEKTGKRVGWVPVTSEDKWHIEAFGDDQWPNGTYELCGPKIQGNPEGYAEHILVKHGCIGLDDCPRDFDSLKEYLATEDIEGVVWHHPDGRMVKIKKKDFGLPRQVKQSA